MTIKAVLFDADGVLLRSHEAVWRAFTATLRHYGFPQKTPKQIMRWNGLADEDWIKKIVPRAAARDERLMLSAARYNRALFARETMLKYAKPARGAKRALRALRRAGVRLAIVTNQGKREVRTAQRVLGFSGFDAVITVDDVRAPKPSPEGLLKALREMRVAPREALFVGDSATDVRAGKRAGVRTLILGKQLKTLAELPAVAKRRRK